MIRAMRYTHTEKADLNLLLSFQALMEERNVTRAARRMFLSQPAMSRAFRRLQDLLHDELLVLTVRGYEPTKRAHAAYAKLEQLLPEIENLLRGQEFTAAEPTELFRIAASSYASVWLLPRIITVLTHRAPKVRLEFAPWNESFERLDANATDLVLTSSPPPPRLRGQLMVQEKFVCLVRTDHPITKQRLTLRRYLACRHVAVSVMNARQRRVEQALADLDKERDVRVDIPSSSSLGPIVEETDLVATLPLRAAEHLAQSSKTRIIPAPRQLGLFAYYQIWHPRNDADPAHQWLRDMIQSNCEHLD